MDRRAVILLAAGVPALAQAWPTFYSAYQDGLAAQARGDHALAIRAFQRAIVLNPQPGRNVRTYGLNFVAVYAPHQHLAESLLALGDLNGAKKMLGQAESLKEASTAERQALRARLLALRKPSATVQAPTPSPAPPPTQVMPAPQVAPQVRAAVPPSTPAPVLAGSAADASAGPRPAPARPLDRETPRRPVETPDSTDLPARRRGAPPVAASTPPQAVPSSAPVQEKNPSRLLGLWALGVALVGGLAATFRVRRRSRPADGRPFHASAPAAAPDLGRTVRLQDPPPPSRDPNLGHVFGRFLAQRVLGRGGCATAYYGLDQETGEEVAIKVPHPHLLDQGDFRARFRREAALGILLAHPRIVPLLDPGPEEGDPWLVTRFIAGDTLFSHLQRHAPLGIPESVAIASDVAEAIHFAHERGVVHRDLKPANVMVTPEGAMVMDFGIARVADGGLTATTMFLGTPLYCAPEAIVSSRVGPPADWYAMGIMLFEMLTGQLPFQAESSFQILECHRSQPLPDLRAIRPMTPPPLEDLVRRMAAKDPDARPDGEEVLASLRRFKALYPPSRHKVDPGLAEAPES